MRKLSIYCLILLLMSACAQSAEKCSSRSEDTAWEPVGTVEIKSNLNEYLRSERSYDIAVDLFGLPEKRATEKKGLRMIWISGSRRTGRTYSCNELIEESHHVSYALLEIDFYEGRGQDCRITIKEFIGPEERPDPFSVPILPTEALSCDAAVEGVEY